MSEKVQDCVDAKAALHAAILAVKKRVPYLQKTESKGLGYRAMMSDDLLEKIAPVLVEEGLTIHPEDIEVVSTSHYTTKSGTVMQSRIYKVTYAITHASGASRPSVAIGEASDTGDKASSKAMTIARKYAIAHAFTIETGDDPDKTPSSRQEMITPEAEAKKNAEKFRIAVDAMRAADGKDVMDLMMATAKKRGFTDEQMKALEEIKVKRYDSLPAESPTSKAKRGEGKKR